LHHAPLRLITCKRRLASDIAQSILICSHLRLKSVMTFLALFVMKVLMMSRRIIRTFVSTLNPCPSFFALLRSHLLMDLFAGLPPAPAAAAPPAKQRAVGSSGSDTHRLLVLMSKLLLSVDQQVRGLRAILLIVLQVPAETPWVSEGMAATKKWAETYAALKSEGIQPIDIRKRIGLPHCHLWNAMLKVGLDYLSKKTDADSKADHAKLLQYVETMQARGVQALAEEVRHVRMCKMYSKQHKKLELNFKVDSESEKMWSILLRCMQATTTVTILDGVAPPGDLVVQLQRFLDENPNGSSGSAGSQR
jgi:hypothetical protein